MIRPQWPSWRARNDRWPIDLFSRLTWPTLGFPKVQEGPRWDLGGTSWDSESEYRQLLAAEWPQKRTLKMAKNIFFTELFIVYLSYFTLAGWIFYEKWHELSEIFYLLYLNWMESPKYLIRKRNYGQFWPEIAKNYYFLIFDQNVNFLTTLGQKINNLTSSIKF